MSTSFEDSALYENIESGDVVYFDPPYVPASDTATLQIMQRNHQNLVMTNKCSWQS